jgi:hypothetical protein
MKTNFKLHLATSKDSLRPAMQSILITKTDIVSTDAHIMAVVPTGDIFDIDSIQCIPDKGLLIDGQIWKSIYTAEQITIYETNGGYKICGHFKSKPSMEFKVEKNGDGANFPNWLSVVPTEDKREEMGLIGINPKLLFNLSEAIGADMGLRLETNGRQKGIVVCPINKEDNKSYGLIMPIKTD